MEVWKDIKGYEGLYQISNLGNVRSYDRWFKNHSKMQFLKGREIKTNLMGIGYLGFSLFKDSTQKKVKVHRLVAEHFVDNPDNKPNVNHKNGIKTDNRAENLEWCTQKENIQHAFDSGLNHKGEKHGNALINEEQAKFIKYSNHTIKELCGMFNLSRSAISFIRSGKRWSHI
jgi:hypothetical protein